MSRVSPGSVHASSGRAPRKENPNVEELLPASPNQESLEQYFTKIWAAAAANASEQ